MSATHTPGPWDTAAAQYTGTDSIAITARDKLAVAHEGWIYVCHMNTHSRADADARLIAAAPDLLAALREARQALAAALLRLWDESSEGDVKEHYAIKAIDAAIARATRDAAELDVVPLRSSRSTNWNWDRDREVTTREVTT